LNRTLPTFLFSGQVVMHRRLSVVLF